VNKEAKLHEALGVSSTPHQDCAVDSRTLKEIDRGMTKATSYPPVTTARRKTVNIQD